MCTSALDPDPVESLLAEIPPREKTPVYTKNAYNFKSHAWIFGSLIRGPVLDLELDIAF